MRHGRSHAVLASRALAPLRSGRALAITSRSCSQTMRGTGSGEIACFLPSAESVAAGPTGCGQTASLEGDKSKKRERQNQRVEERMCTHNLTRGSSMSRAHRWSTSLEAPPRPRAHTIGDGVPGEALTPTTFLSTPTHSDPPTHQSPVPRLYRLPSSIVARRPSGRFQRPWN
jgi:hypothetical protein